MMARVKCPICQEFFDSNKVEYVFIKDRHYHRKCCSEDFLHYEMIFDYLKKIWGACSRVKIAKQIDSMIREYKYSSKQIYDDLQYFFEIKGNDTTSYKNTINIVPYIHDEAQKYYRLIEYKENKKERLTQKLEEVTEEDKVIYVNKQPKRNKILFELETEEG